MLVHCRGTPSSKLLVPIYTPGWREELWELSLLPKNTMPWPWPGLEPRPLDLESSALTITSPCLPHWVVTLVKKVTSKEICSIIPDLFLPQFETDMLILIQNYWHTLPFWVWIRTEHIVQWTNYFIHALEKNAIEIIIYPVTNLKLSALTCGTSGVH